MKSDIQMMEGNVDKINEKIEHIIACLHQHTSEQQKNNLFRMARQVLSNESVRQNTDTPQQLQQRIIGKIALTCDQRSTLECQQIIQRFYQNGGITKKHEVLIMLIKLSQLIKTEQLDISRIFHHSKTDPNRTLDASRNGYSYILQHEKHQMPQQSNEQLLMIKNRGILDANITGYDLVKQLSYVFTNTATSQIIQINDGYQLRPNLEVSYSIREMVDHIADLGWLHRKILSYLNKQGSIRKALCQTVHEQLKQFYIWNRTMQELIKKNELSLRKMYVMSFYPEQILRWLAIILQSVESYNGCHMISIVNSFRPHGIQAVDALLNRTLKYIIRPLMNYIHSWIYMGELLDSRNQFFIHEDKKVIYGEEWKKRFKLIPQNIPNILNEQSATMIFNTGKTIHFLKNKMKIFYKIKTPFIQIQNNQEFKIQNAKDLISTLFMNWLSQVSKQVNKLMVQTLYNNFHLRYHLQSMRDFFLCGKGDLIQQLYDSMNDVLSHNVNEVSEHTLDGYISDAITRCYTNVRLPYTNSSFIQSIVSRFLAIKSKIDTKAIYCWQTFNFRYTLDGIEPLQTIFTSDIMQNYQKIFNFLWKLKKMMENLKYLWMSLDRQEAFKVKNLDNKMCIGIFQFIYILKNEMIQFIMNLHSYFMIAIDQRWNIFCQDIGKSLSFDEILDKHKEFQLNILEILLITSGYRPIYQCLHSFFEIIDHFKVVCGKLQDLFNDYHFNAGSSVKRQVDMAYFAQNTTQNHIRTYCQILRKLKVDFQEAIKKLCYHLQKQKQNKISNLGVLLTRLDFNQYYTINIL